MEEAYSELYQQYLRLRSLCLRQAALLHQLTTALQKQQGATVPNAELNDTMSIPVQSSQAIPVLFHEKPQPLTVAPQCCIPRNVDTYSYLLAEGMSKLCMDLPLQAEEDGKLEPKVAPLLDLDSSRWHGAFSSESKNPGQPVHPGRDKTVHTSRVGNLSQNNMPRLALFQTALRFFTCSPSQTPCRVLFVPDACVRQSVPFHGLPEPAWWVTDVRHSAAVTSMRLLPGRFPRKHNHQRRVHKTSSHPHHLDAVDQTSHLNR